jgi:hypothetical protein
LSAQATAAATLPPERIFSWESKVTDYSTEQKRVVRAFRWGKYGDRKCPFCSIPLRAQDLHSQPLQVHHTIPRGMLGCNLLINVRLAHGGCNANAGKPQYPASIPKGHVRESRESVRAWASEEGERSSKMRPIWNLTVYGPGGLLCEQGARIHRRGLAKQAPGLVGSKLGKATFGSMVTYDRYITEDTGAGFLEEIGDKIVERTGKAFPFTELEGRL